MSSFKTVIQTFKTLEKMPRGLLGEVGRCKERRGYNQELTRTSTQIIKRVNENWWIESWFKSDRYIWNTIVGLFEPENVNRGECSECTATVAITITPSVSKRLRSLYTNIIRKEGNRKIIRSFLKVKVSGFVLKSIKLASCYGIVNG